MLPYKDRPLNFAHRGASYEAPENTLAAFLRAAEMGADGIELDVRLSRDGHVVVVHDSVLQTTTDGRGRVQDKTLAELRVLDAGWWFAPGFAGQRIPTLQEVIDAVGQSLLLNVELKTVSLQGHGLVEETVRIVERNRFVDRVIISSFNTLALRHVQAVNPCVRTGLLYGPAQHGSWLRHVARPQALHPQHVLVDPTLVSWARDKGYRLHVWTVDEPARMAQLAAWGVDLIISNRPDLLAQVLTKR